jgi:hypothetical protein
MLLLLLRRVRRDCGGSSFGNGLSLVHGRRVWLPFGFA